MDSTHTWEYFEQFYLNYCSSYWSKERIDLPFGTFLPLHPEDDASMLYAADLAQAAPQDILNQVRLLGEERNLPIGFYISPTWKGKVAEFCHFLADNGFHESHRMIPHILDDLSVAQKIDDSAFTIRQSDDPYLIAEIFKEVFKVGKEYAQMIIDRLTHPQTGPVQTVFFTAYAPDGEPAGIASCNYDNQFGYMNCLAVREPYRRQGLAAHLIKVRLDHLHENNVGAAVTIVGWKNVASLHTQAKIGYRKLTEVSVWKTKPQR